MDAKMWAAKDTRTTAEKESLCTLIRTYQGRYPGIIIRGHRDWLKVAKAARPSMWRHGSGGDADLLNRKKPDNG